MLHLAVEGATRAEITARMFISPHTIEMHRTKMLCKPSVGRQAELFRCALQ